MKITIKQLSDNNNAPIKLLLLADPSEQLVKKYLSEGTCYIALNEESVVGVILIIYKADHCVEIMNIAVEENYQKQGIGKKLLNFVKKDLKEKGIKTLEIGTGNSSIFQLMLYQRVGFRITDIDFNFFSKNYPEPIFENGIECRDMIKLNMEL